VIRADGLEKDFMLGIGNGTKSKGRPRLRWLDEIREAKTLIAGSESLSQGTLKIGGSWLESSPRIVTDLAVQGDKVTNEKRGTVEYDGKLYLCRPRPTEMNIHSSCDSRT